MKERPIPFSAPMVRAILAGIKTQTRRVVKPVGDDDGFALQDYGDGWWPYRSDDGESSMKNGMEIPHSCPYSQPGGLLWLREAYRFEREFDDIKPSEVGPGQPVWYEAQDEVPFHPTAFGKLRPGMFMPRWASRITLEVTGVRVERLQDISIEDAKAEGAWPDESVVDDCVSYFGIDVLEANPRRAFRMLWERINGPSSWEANPWVWVVEFRRLPC